jgi:hypothetical protein
VARPTGASADELSAWLVREGLAIRRGGRLYATARGAELGDALLHVRENSPPPG